MVRVSRTLARFAPLLGVGLFVAALLLLHHGLRNVHFHEIRGAFQSIAARRVLGAAGAAAFGYFVLTLYDMLAFTYLQRTLPYSRVGFASFVGWALSNNVGYSVLSGGSIRYRLYSSWGLNSVEIAQLVGFCTFTAWLGFITLGGAALLYEPQVVAGALHVPLLLVRGIGLLLMFVSVLYVVFLALWRKPVVIRGFEIRLPSPPMGATQIGLGCLDLTAAAMVLFLLLPMDAHMSFAAFAGVFVIAILLGMVSQVPGGIGVFECVLLFSLKPFLPASQLIASLLMFRVVYYLMPLAGAVVAFGLYESRAFLRPAARAYSQWLSPVVPNVLAFSTFVCGAILLFSGATPALPGRMHVLRDLLPLPAIEVSHFMASVVGVVLVLLARALQRRIDLAFWIATVLLGVGAVFSLTKGLDYEEAAILLLMLGVFVPSRSHFHRRATLFAPRFDWGWFAACLVVLMAFLWLGAFSHKHVEYTHELWWQFSLHGDAPRFLRASVGVLIAASGFGLAFLLGPAPYEPSPLSEADNDVLREIVAGSRSTTANLALLGDKAVLFNDARTAFIMYGIEGRSWIAMGDPVGPENEWEELVWSYRERCHRYGGWPVFYQVSADSIPLYLDAGLDLLKLGEEGRVALAVFSIEGSHWKDERYSLRKIEKEGYVFEVIPQASVSEMLPALRAVSDEWLQSKNAREKRFSLGSFDEVYLRYFPHAVVRREGEIVAFANVWHGAEKEELSIDLMRYGARAPHGVMDYLLLHLMLWAKAEGYQWFSLGMAPLAGLENRALAPLWHRVGAFVFRHGEHFYNFQGLRQYKDKFDPVWKPRYLASPGGLALPQILTNIASLVGGGVVGVVRK